MSKIRIQIHLEEVDYTPRQLQSDDNEQSGTHRQTRQISPQQPLHFQPSTQNNNDPHWSLHYKSPRMRQPEGTQRKSDDMQFGPRSTGYYGNSR